MDNSSYNFLKDKDILIWGAGIQGRGILQTLENKGFSVKAFVDTHAESVKTNPLIKMYPVYSPAQLDEVRRNYLSPAIIIATVYSQERIIDICKSAGFIEETEIIRLDKLTSFTYEVDISGVCNLRCISCPQGQTYKNKRPTGFMSASTFERVVDKIKVEDPSATSVLLFKWGEPLLNKELPEIITIAREKGLASYISTNLNPKADLDSIIKAKPTCFRISLSGFGPRYEVTHTGGKFAAVCENLNKLYEVINKYNSNLKIQVFYHLYKDNRGEDLKKAREFCASRGFELQTIWASVISLEDLKIYKETGYLPEAAQKAADLMEMDLDLLLLEAKAQAHKKCQLENMISINWDLSVLTCGFYYSHPENIVVDNFLEISLSDLMALKKKAKICIPCKQNGFHTFCDLITNFPPDNLPDNLINPSKIQTTDSTIPRVSL
ncbi:MAG: radical SAM protein [Deltaproteobacteria bacterium]|jgi:MoaA/NifB/PqqE/SkfB family radical SAM enzyme|nr:radical SAM protein [Deltaproteobacteria bacterium]